MAKRKDNRAVKEQAESRATELGLVDYTSPEYLGWPSAQGAWRAVLRNPFAYGSAYWNRWQKARDLALGNKRERFQELVLHDRQIEPVRFRYDTDERGAA